MIGKTGTERKKKKDLRRRNDFEKRAHAVWYVKMETNCYLVSDAYVCSLCFVVRSFSLI